MRRMHKRGRDSERKVEDLLAWMVTAGEIDQYVHFPQYSPEDMAGIDFAIFQGDRVFFIQVKSSLNGIFRGITKDFQYDRVQKLYLNARQPAWRLHSTVKDFMLVGKSYESKDLRKISGD